MIFATPPWTIGWTGVLTPLGGAASPAPPVVEVPVVVVVGVVVVGGLVVPVPDGVVAARAAPTEAKTASSGAR